MKQQQSNIVSTHNLLATLAITVLAVLASCDAFMPNFLIGTWAAPGANGDEKLTFTKEGDFSAQFYNKDGTAQKIAGKYKAGKSVVQLSYKGADGTMQKSIAAYKMYPKSMDFMYKGKKTKYYKF